jgi:putative DNA primase/helicase
VAEPRLGEWLIVGEGIETVMSVMQCTGLPGWAALSAPGLEQLVLPPTVTKVIIAGDHDANGRGQRAADQAARQWLAEGRAVKIALPPVPDTAWNDVLMGRCPARIEETSYAA